jgi:toxin ParE1/3/4
MKAIKIIWRKSALHHLKQIHKYISFDSVVAANKLIRKIRESVERLKYEPLIGQKETLLEDYGLNYRYLVDGHYKIYYQFDNKQIYIVAVFDSRRNPESLPEVVGGGSS